MSDIHQIALVVSLVARIKQIVRINVSPGNFGKIQSGNVHNGFANESLTAVSKSQSGKPVGINPLWDSFGHQCSRTFKGGVFPPGHDGTILKPLVGSCVFDYGWIFGMGFLNDIQGGSWFLEFFWNIRYVFRIEYQVFISINENGPCTILFVQVSNTRMIKETLGSTMLFGIQLHIFNRLYLVLGHEIRFLGPIFHLNPIRPLVKDWLGIRPTFGISKKDQIPKRQYMIMIGQPFTKLPIIIHPLETG
mmetsp:Transcript_23927/g.58479  ORF Transcript_23927/g.58479 Transcript_23927/m.58479 type:complete len:248 (-) Transcript_23927:501-1244(-)